ncbi:flagellar basal body L-ring protein FlgH [Alginatibacterium sediminis]|uniref:Flagellar L-ring protein n=1 Tax=Alginatibacterium sediminis TaxID=2164068 RepID=A0A420EG30_9ALTE|nr:flagellar basal body L-ring protein FlgH [Alginatibacterium sediminis]RKF19628.1 flagellar basal body L-ring protein FlgH [Alginatibacterium sediminis]
MIRLMMTSVLSLALAACSSPNYSVVPDDPAFAPVYPEVVPQQAEVTGSLFTKNYANNLYSDQKAHRVGDIIVVNLDESTQAKKSATNENAKNNKFQVDSFSVPTGTPIVGGIDLAGTSFGQTRSFNGEADAAQSNSLAGNISVNVIEVLANGNLIISGEKWLMLNNGNEYIRLTGIIRPQDVDPDNSITSQRVANARINYGGTGDFANSTESGWATKFFNGPIWPF